MSVLCSEDWYGMMYSFADSKKKSNLMLSVFMPGNYMQVNNKIFCHISRFHSVSIFIDGEPVCVRILKKWKLMIRNDLVVNTEGEDW